MGAINLSLEGVDLAEIRRELCEGIHARDVLAGIEARKAAALNAQFHRTLGAGSRGGSFGEVRMRLPVHVALAWKHREGRDVMRDSFWQAYMRRHFPGFFPKVRSTKVEATITNPGLPGQLQNALKGKSPAPSALVDRTGCPLPASSASVSSVSGSEVSPQ